MANTIDAFLERLTGASGEFNKAKVGKLAFLGNVYLDVRPEIARQGQTIRIYFPDTGAWVDQAANDWVLTDTNPGFVDIPFGLRPGYGIKIHDFEQFQTATNIIDQFIEPMYLRGQEYANGIVAGLITTANFATYPALQSSTLGSIDIDTAANAWDILVGAKVPIQNPDQAALIVHNHIHRNMLTDTQWYQESLVGAMIAQGTRTRAAESGDSRTSFNFNRYWDQQVVTGLSANLTSTVTTTTGSIAVLGAATTFTSQAPKGSWVQFGTDTAFYRVAALDATTPDTKLTLTQQYQGTGAAGVTVKRQTFNSVAMHRYAIALAVRPLEIVNDGHIHSRLLMLNGLPFRVTVAWNHLMSSWVLTMDYGMVAKVIRSDFGIVIQS